MNIKILPPFFPSDILSHSLKPCMKTKPSIFLLITITPEFFLFFFLVSLKAGKQAKRSLLDSNPWGCKQSDTTKQVKGSTVIFSCNMVIYTMLHSLQLTFTYSHLVTIHNSKI